MEPVTTSELRAVSAELKQQWLSTSQSHAAHDLLASIGSSSTSASGVDAKDNDDGNGNGEGKHYTSSEHKEETEGKSETSTESKSKFVKRGTSLRDKLRGTVSQARTESRYFS